MDFFQGLIIITSIHLLAAASPGPDFVLVSQKTLSQGRKAGIWCSVGIALGLSIHIIYSAFGLATVIKDSSTLMWAIKLLGGSYLLYLGYCGLTATAKSQQAVSQDFKQAESKQTSINSESSVAQFSIKKEVATGFFCNALNPKAPIYFISLFTVVLSADMPVYQLFAYGIWMMIIQLLWFSLVVLLLSQPLLNNKFQRMSHWIDRVFGLAMIGLGLKVLLGGNNSGS